MAAKPRHYETLYIIRPDIKEEDLSKIQQRLRDAISANEGEIIKFDKWAQRELAYEIQDYSRGIYYIIIFKSLPGAVPELERHLRFYNTDVLRFLTVSITDAAANKERAVQETKAAEESKAGETKAPEESVAPLESQAEAAAQPVEEAKTENEPAATEPAEGGTN